MKKLMKPANVEGTVKAPASKSVAQRAIAIAALTKGQSEIYNFGNSDDVLAAIRVCKALGVEIQQHPEKLIINGGIKVPDAPLDCGEAGLGIRMFSPLVATLNEPVTLTGSGTLTKRPMDIIEQAIVEMGADCKTNKGYLPITVKGPIKGGIARIDGSLSSQVLTGMLIAAPKALSDLTIYVNNLQSKPYIDLTIDVMKLFGVDVENFEYKTFKVKTGVDYKPAKVIVEGDWSGAAFLMVAGSIAGKVRVDNISYKSKQADRAILDALKMVGAEIKILDNHIEITKNKLNPFSFDATDCPDLFPPLVALAAHCNGKTTITGVGRLRVKESDRAATLQKEFAKLNVNIEISGEDMIIYGTELRGGVVNSHGDHRIAMACAVAALKAKENVEIQEAEAVAKSYPEFFENLNALTQ